MHRVRLKARAVSQILLSRNMTQSDLARKAKLTTGHMSQLIHGERSPTPAVRLRLMKALATTDFDQIFEIEEAHDVRENDL